MCELVTVWLKALVRESPVVGEDFQARMISKHVNSVNENANSSLVEETKPIVNYRDYW